MILDASLLNTQLYKVRIRGKEKHPSLHLNVVAIEKGAFGLPSTTVGQVTYLLLLIEIDIDLFFK